MGLYHALLYSSLLFFSSTSLVQSVSFPLESTISSQLQSTLLGQTDSEDDSSPHHRGSGR
jgi:hypothetical protein